MSIGRLGARDQGVTTVETYRYVATNGQTSVSGADVGGRTLTYPINYEVVFLNGVRLVRGDDYQATTGTSITNIDAMSASDVIEVMVFQALDIANAITTSAAAATYAPLVSPALIGTPTAPTAAADTNTTQIATTAYVVGQGYAKLVSPTLTGVPTAPTASVNTNTTQIATTAYVNAEIANDAVLNSLSDAAGDLIVGSADNSFGRLAAGSNGQILTVNTSGSGVNRLQWASAPQTGFNPFLLMGA